MHASGRAPRLGTWQEDSGGRIGDRVRVGGERTSVWVKHRRAGIGGVGARDGGHRRTGVAAIHIVAREAVAVAAAVAAAAP